MNIREARQQFDLLLSVDSDAGPGDVQKKTGPQEESDQLNNCNESDLSFQDIREISPKRKRRDPSRRQVSDTTMNMAHIMTLYDRSINLDHISNDSSLYSTSRAWMRNRPSEPIRQPKEGDAEEQSVCCYDCTETSPFFIAEPPTPIERGSIPLRVELDIHTLRKMNLKRWQAVKEKCRETYEENYRAHPECVSFIKGFYQPSSPTAASDPGM